MCTAEPQLNRIRRSITEFERARILYRAYANDPMAVYREILTEYDNVLSAMLRLHDRLSETQGLGTQGSDPETLDLPESLKPQALNP